jgi:hypothetical protein
VRIALVLAALLAAGGFKARGFSLPDGAVKVDDDRYRLPQPWEDAVRWYRSVYPPAKYPRSTLRNQSGIRAIHIANPAASAEWEGANLYETAKGEVRVFVLAHEEPKPREEPKPAEEPKAQRGK